ncbi:RagB/SusD family nutrient uptake outer membrane protein [Mucilaginibacter sp. cycad4]|uniref:RagB/SusD family nutrient uptake outer membrane protein n=1 Tax=Mucilaginibacter sp. cycad4 TaxID=3342096 RepID=UPI002AAB7AD0|nr:RagB/SusD family nutrient uptake outer membrane protein [Mucilaginibacter gossypii]WPV02135.1 RagB/SusD family nutrient uptake outer membrane protein [Mucilaginibacter gossypii]
MKKNIIYIGIIASFITLGLGLVGCKKALDLNPLDAISDASFYKDASQFKLAANNFYGYLRSFNVSNGDGHSGSDLTADRGAFARGTNTAASTDGNYSEAYSWIRTINYFLDKAAAYSKPAEIKTYVAEAHFFRGYVYFDKLFQNYGGVILVKQTLTPQSAELYLPRNTRQETLDFIIQELEAAITDLPLESAIAAGDKGRVSKQAAQAFLARVCLYEGTWQKFRGGDATKYNGLLDKSIANSDAVITSGQYSLFKPAALGDSALKYLFILENQKSNPANITKAGNQEYILSVRFESANLLKTIPGQISFGALGADVSKKIADMYLCTDGLPITKTTVPFTRAKLNDEFKNRDNRMRYFMVVPGYRYWQNAANWHINWDWSPADIANARPAADTWANSVSGYENQQWSAERQVPNGQEGYDYPTIRLAEVYLNYAEAVYERNGSISDADLDKSLNQVRNRVNSAMPKLSNAFAAAHGLDMREEIRRERAVEFQGEPFRMDDLKRWYIAHIELNQPVLGVQWTGTEYETKYTSAHPTLLNGFVLVDPVTERKFSEKNYLLPLPTSELQLNSKLVQNPGW